MGAPAADVPGLHRARPALPPALRALSYFGYAYKRTWRGSLATSFLYPVLYLTAMGLGLGTLVTRHVHLVGGVRYVVFLAPGLLASTAMQIGSNEATYPVMAAIKWIRTYLAMLATPLSVTDVLIGHLGWIAVRLTIVSSIYLAVMAAFGTVTSGWAVLALPAAVLTGVAFAAPICAFSATQQNDVGFSTLYRFVLVPLFLFSGTFFPLSRLPGWLQPVAAATPLEHGVALCRGLTLGSVSWGAAGDAAYLLALAAIGVALARRSFVRRLVV